MIEVQMKTCLSLPRALFISPTPVLSPLLHSQGIPHMHELAKKGMRFILLSMEAHDWTDEQQQRAEELRRKLEDWGIEWRVMHYGKRSFIPATLRAVFRCVWIALRIVRQERVEVVHGRSYVPACVFLIIRRFVRAKYIFDMRGFLPDEYVRAGYWKQSGIRYRISKWFERRCLHMADSIIVTSEGMRKELFGWYENIWPEIEPKLRIIPNLTDVNRFRYDPEIREVMRKQYGVQNCLVLLWVASGITRMHMPEEIASFIRVQRHRWPNLRLLVLTRTPNAAQILTAASLREDEFMILSVLPEQVPSFILMADAGLSFLDPRHYGSAIKQAEYLACGLPLVASWTVEQLDTIVYTNRTGIVVDAFDEKAYKKAGAELEELLKERGALRERCRFVAEKYMSLDVAVQAYVDVYRQMVPGLSAVVCIPKSD